MLRKMQNNKVVWCKAFEAGDSYKSIIDLQHALLQLVKLKARLLHFDIRNFSDAELVINFILISN